MKVNVNKDQLIKHHFWILTGCYLVVALIPLILLGTGVSDTITKEQGDLDKTKQGVKSITSPKNDNWVKAYEKQDHYVDEKKNQVWKQAWELQKDMQMIWPPELQDTFSTRYPYMGDAFSDNDAYAYAQKYSTQYQELFDSVDPVRSREQGAVQFRGATTLKDMVQLLEIDHQFTPVPPLPTRDDIWLAQEDIWVKRELLRIIREANDSVAIFKEVKAEAKGGDAKDKKGTEVAPPAAVEDPNHKIFRNAYWELDLRLTPTTSNDKVPFKLSGKITNISDRKLACGNVYNVYLGDSFDSGFARLAIDHEPLAAGESYDFGTVDGPPTVQFRGLYGVEQVWTWRTAPVKRIDDVRLGYNSSRTASIYRSDKWKRPRWAPAPEKAEGDPNAAPGGDMPGGLGGTMPMGGFKMGRMGMGAAGAGQGDLTKHNLNLVRYSDVNEQVRHMPVALVVVMDERHIPDFLAAVDNSKLRIQLLQFHWHHLRDEKIMPPAEESTGEGGTQPAPAARAPGTVPGVQPGQGGSAQMGQKMVQMMQMGQNRSKMMQGAQMQAGQTMPRGFLGRKMGGGMGSMGMGGLMAQRGMMASGLGGMPATEEEEETEMDLVEVAVYGLASLYEKYPPDTRPKAAATPGTEQK
jgi:hypothetical protein